MKAPGCGRAQREAVHVAKLLGSLGVSLERHGLDFSGTPAGVHAMPLITPFLSPVLAAEPYEPTRDVVAYQVPVDGLTAAEIFSRPDGSLGFRFAAWVAWRDAGGEAREHGWECIHPERSLFADRLEVAADEAIRHARYFGLQLGDCWVNP